MQRIIEGNVVPGSSCLVVEDVITTGSSVLDTCTVLKDVGVNASHTVVLLDREQGGRANIEKEGVAVSSVLTLSELMEHLVRAKRITSKMSEKVNEFISMQKQNSTSTASLPGGSTLSVDCPRPLETSHCHRTVSYPPGSLLFLFFLIFPS